MRTLGAPAGAALLAWIVATGLCVSGRAVRADGSATQVSGTIENEDGSAKLVLKGSVPKWPDGAYAFVKFFVKDGPDIEWYRMDVKGGAFQSTFNFPKKKTAPMKYRAELWLRVPMQPPRIRLWFQREFAVSNNHSELVDVCEVTFGTQEERWQFRADVQKSSAELLDKVKAHVQKVSDAIDKAPDPSWGETSKQLLDENAAISKEYTRLTKEYVCLGKEFALLTLVNQAAFSAWNAITKAKASPANASTAAEQARQALDGADKTLEKLRNDLETEKSAAADADKPKDDAAGAKDAPKAPEGAR